MSAADVHSFVGKFLSLWASGRDTSLKLQCKHGKANVTMELELWNETCDNIQNSNGNVTRHQRRKDRRSCDRNTATKEAGSKVVVNGDEVKVADNEEVKIKSQVNDLHLDQISQEENIQFKLENDNDITQSHNDELIQENNSAHDDKETVGEDDVTTVALQEVSVDVVVNDHETGKSEEVMEASDVNKKVDAMQNSDSKSTNNGNETVLVYSQVNFENCPKRVLTANELKVVEEILFRKDHLKQNIRSYEFGHYGTRHSDDGQDYAHTLDLKLYVETGRLWETPRSYVFRHMGQDTWTVNDGTQISLNRIHVKR